MKVVYTAPNRAHHYRYALAMFKADVLSSFISGLSRFSPFAKFDELGSKIHRADFLQTLYVASLKFGAPARISKYLAYWSKIEQDLACKKFIKSCDIFMFYNGSGLHSCRFAHNKGIITVVEAVNSHVQYQEDILQEEHRSLSLPWVPFNKKEKNRRIDEYKEADYILLPSEFVKNSFLELGFPEHKLLKVPYGFSPFMNANTETASEEKSEDFTVLYVGSISVRKGLRYLLQAFEQLQHPRKKLIIVGPKTKLTGIDDLNIPPQVSFTGVLKGEALQKAYRSASVFCLPSIEEGLALVLGEALSYGLPIIATTNTGAADIISDGKEGFIVPIRDSNSIHEKLQFLADEKESYYTMKISAKEKSLQLNGWEETGQLLVSTLSQIKDKK
ncbi:hypothetical protein GCM10027299_41610 [Larkinella ripae]